MNIRRVSCAVGLALAVVASSQVAASAADTVPPPDNPDATYYLALGDSLSVGWQPTSHGEPAIESNHGYADDLYAKLKVKDPKLELVKLGCAGETTTSMLNGRTPSKTAASCQSYQKDFSQVDAAVDFFKQHPGQVKFVTNDIGANDVQSCAKATGIDIGCAVQGIAALSGNLPQILNRLKAASGPAPIYVGMNYYNPFLAAYLSGGNGIFLAAVTSLAEYVVNTIEENEYRAVGARVADVSGAFGSYDLTPKPYGTAQVPTAVYNICTLTWMCTDTNIHANNAGYQVIANAFAAVLPDAIATT